MNPTPGGAFALLLNLVRLSLGGAQGNGRQFVSWIHGHDFARAIEFLIARDDLDGPINIAAPTPVPNREFMATLREAWGMPNGIPAPALLLEIAALFMRTESELVLKSRNVIPARLLREGFEFEFPTWAEAAKDLVRQYRQRD
jgi:NAD dependent epimerase/dehydratase family enzyme